MLRRLQRRRKAESLLETRWTAQLHPVIFMVAMVVAVISLNRLDAPPSMIMPLAGLFGLVASLAFEVARLRRRLDAAVDLLKADGPTSRS